MNNALKATLIIVVIAVLATATVVTAAYLMTSNTIAGTPTGQAILTLTPSTVTPVSGVSWTLTAHISDDAEGVTIALKNNGSPVTSDITDSSGNAVFTVAPTAPFSYIATADHP